MGPVLVSVEVMDASQNDPLNATKSLKMRALVRTKFVSIPPFLSSSIIIKPLLVCGFLFLADE